MNKEVKKLVTELLSGSISPDEFTFLYPAKQISEEYCIDLLREALSDADSEKVEEGLIVGFSANCFQISQPIYFVNCFNRIGTTNTKI